MTDDELLRALVARIDELEARIDRITQALFSMRGDDDDGAGSLIRSVVDIALAAEPGYQPVEADALVRRAQEIIAATAREALEPAP